MPLEPLKKLKKLKKLEFPEKLIAYPLSTRFITSRAKTRFQDKYYLKTKLKFLWELRFVVSKVRKSVSKKGPIFLRFVVSKVRKSVSKKGPIFLRFVKKNDKNKKLKKLNLKKKKFELKENLKIPCFLKNGGVLKENYIPKNGLYIGLHQITCNFF